MDGILVLSNGRSFRGRLRGARKSTSGEVIFNTAMTGYQEILTDPSYCGQIITMTYPHIGNYGVNAEDAESRTSFAGGMIVKELSRVVSNWRADGSLDDYLNERGITVLEGVDTRALVIALREHGALPGLIAPAEGCDTEALAKEAAALPGMEGRNLAREVSVTAPYHWEDGRQSGQAFRVIAYDYGIKYNILRSLARRNAAVEVVPYNFPVAETLARNPYGVFLSNGPGDPEPVREGVDTRALVISLRERGALPGLIAPAKCFATDALANDAAARPGRA
ncbi:MAG: carbamoyl phosphate synthase small subunit, partial [SAR324 cluster bacterium]|nr:carbamoyl phosphate synthase small subunit [SAR324 cluster bacterium]